MTRQLAVLIPRPGSAPALWIDRGSGIVADVDAAPPWHLDVYFEGNRYGAENLRTFAERVQQAAGRLAQQAPTIARCQYPREAFIVVGVFTFSDDWHDTRLTITEPDLVAQWTGETP